MTKLNPLSRAAATAAAAAGACLLAVACPAPALAAGGSKTSTGAGESTPLNLSPVSTGSHSSSSSGGSIVRTIVGLAIVIAVIWGLAWIMRQVKSGRGEGGPHSSSTGLTSIAALNLSTGRSVHLVKAGSDYLLLGSAEQGVVPIHRYTEDEARQAGLLDVIDAPAKPRRALLRPPTESMQGAGGAVVVRRPGAGHDPMRMPQDRPGSGVLDRLRELTVRR